MALGARPLAALSIAAAAALGGGTAAGAAPASTTCPGDVDIAGFGRAAVTSAFWNVPSDGAGLVDVVGGSGEVRAHMKGRSYLAESCMNGKYSNERYLALRLIGRRLRYTTDVSGAGCGCNAAFYLVSMRQNPEPSDCSDYYCDANSVCGERCAEIDLQEANEYAWHSTLHAAADGAGVGGGLGGGDSWNGPRDWTTAEYSPGGRCIDTSKPFHVEVSFPTDASGALRSMDVVLSQDGTPCHVSTSAGMGYAGLAELTKALEAGMTPVFSYWSSNSMLWMDGQGADRKGACAADHKEACGDTVRFYNFSLESINGAGSAADHQLSAGSSRAERAAGPLTASVPKAAAPPQVATSTVTTTTQAATTTTQAATTTTMDHVPPTSAATPEPSAARPADIAQRASRPAAYEFVGYAGPEEARKACGPTGRLAMPKTTEEQERFVALIHTAKRDGHMSDNWPHNTVWVGGRWNAGAEQWQWDDGTPILGLGWAKGQPSAKGHQEKEPWLCVAEDQVHDAGWEWDHMKFRFGVVCEAVPQAATTAVPPTADEPIADVGATAVGDDNNANDANDADGGEGSGDDEVDGVCCDWGDSCGACRRWTAAGAWCGGSKSRCSSCLKVWCERGRGSGGDAGSIGDLVMRKDAEQGALRRPSGGSPAAPTAATASAAAGANFLGLATLAALAGLALAASSGMRFARRRAAVGGGSRFLYDQLEEQAQAPQHAARLPPCAAAEGNAAA